jgi:hypothetical protein
MWSAYQNLGGSAVLGAPVASPSSASATGEISQQFEHGLVEIRPDVAAPCNVIMTPAS